MSHATRTQSSSRRERREITVGEREYENIARRLAKIDRFDDLVEAG